MWDDGVQWVAEACYYCPGTSCILVGLNAHLRTDSATLKHLKSKGITPVTVPQATELAKRIKAIKYTEYAQHESGATAFFEDSIRSLVFPTTRLQKVFLLLICTLRALLTSFGYLNVGRK